MKLFKIFQLKVLFIALIILVRICYGQDFESKTTFETKSVMGPTLYSYFLSDEHSRYLLFKKWPKKDEFETSNDFEKRLLKWKIQNQIIKKFKFRNLSNVFPDTYNADKQEFLYISLYDIQQPNSSAILNQYHNTKQFNYLNMSKCWIVFNFDISNSGLDGDIGPCKNCENIDAHFSMLSDFDEKKLFKVGVNITKELAKNAFINLNIWSLKCPIGSAKRIKENRDKLRWEIEFSTDMHVASNRPWSPYVFDIRIYKLRLYLLDSDISFDIINNMPPAVISNQEFYLPTKEIKLSERQVLEASKAIDIAAKNKDINEMGKYLADNVIIKLKISGAQGVQNYQLNKEQYISAIESTWKTVTEYQIELIDRKIELSPDGNTAKVIEKSYEKMIANGSKINTENITTSFFVLINGRLFISEVNVEGILK